MGDGGARCPDVQPLGQWPVQWRTLAGDLRRQPKRAVAAGERLAVAQAEGGQWLGLREEAADNLLSQAAELLILAHQRCQEAHGVNRAVGTARRGETWTAYSVADTSDWLAEAGQADQARKAARTT